MGGGYSIRGGGLIIGGKDYIRCIFMNYMIRCDFRHEKYGDSNGLFSKSLRPRCQSATSQVPFVCSAAIDQHCDVLHARVLEMRSMMTWYSHGIWENGSVSETPATMFGFIRMMVRRYWPPTTTYLRANLKHVSCWGSHCTGG